MLFGLFTDALSTYCIIYSRIRNDRIIMNGELGGRGLL